MDDWNPQQQCYENKSIILEDVLRENCFTNPEEEWCLKTCKSLDVTSNHIQLFNYVITTVLLVGWKGEVHFACGPKMYIAQNNQQDHNTGLTKASERY